MAQTFTLYHVNEDRFRDAMCDIPLPFSAYHVVATVEAECVEHVYQLTNHGVPGQADNWTDNPGVTLMADRARTRSTSVGDIVVDVTGQGWRVASMGFEPFTVPLSASKA